MDLRKFLLLKSFFYSLKSVWKYRRRLNSESDFVLRVAPLKNKKNSSYRNYFPPPLYGIPPGRSVEGDNSNPSEYGKYGLFLWPDDLYRDVKRYTWLLLLTIVPFVFLAFYEYLCCPESLLENRVYYYVLNISILLIITISMKWIFILLFRSSKPVLSQIWRLWPESQYERFSTVPHFTDLAQCDIGKKTNKYWKPDEDSPLKYQPEYYGKEKQSIQEVMLHFSVFDYLFKKKKKGIVYIHNSLKMRGWLFLFSPIWISYLLLLISFFFTSFTYISNFSIISKLPPDIPVLVVFPYFYVPLIIIWFSITFNLIIKQIDFLEQLNEDISNGYYEAYLELVPQQILRVVEKLPKTKQIRKGIERVESIVRVVQAGALVSFLMIIEIFSSAYS